MSYSPKSHPLSNCFFYNFKGRRGPKKGRENGSISAASRTPFWFSSEAAFLDVWPGKDGKPALRELGARSMPSCRRARLCCASSRSGAQAALIHPDHNVAHRLAGLHQFVRGGDVGEVEGLRHVVGELAALEHARDVGGGACAQLRRHQV